MPRPKRTKLAPSAPTSRVATTAPAVIPPSQQRNVSNQPTGRVATTSDDSEGVVTTSATLKNRRGVEKRDFFMSGGLGTGDVQDAHRKPGATRRKPAAVDTAKAREQAKVIEGLKKRREAAMAKQKVSVVEVPSSIPASGAEDGVLHTRAKGSEMISAVESISSETGSRSQGTPGAETSILALANFKRRPRQPSILQVAQQDVGNAYDDLYDDSDEYKGKENTVDRTALFQADDETEFGAKGTPGGETSLLALANFKRRPRQPSILQIVQQDVGNIEDDLYDASDAENQGNTVDQNRHVQPEDENSAQGTPGAEVSTLALANFKRRPRQPSVMQVVLQQGGGNGDDNDLYDDDDNVGQIGTFQPEDESTPFIVSRAKSQIETIFPPLSSSPTPEPLPSSKKRKITPVEVQVPRSSPPEARSSPSTEHEHNEDYNFQNLHNDDQEPSSEQPEAHSDREPTPQVWSDTLAPPLSSSPSQPNPNSITRPEYSTRTATGLTKRKQPARDNHPPNNNDSPTKPSNLPAKTRTRTRQPLSTATLQSLLPRRRTRARPSTFDIPSSDDVDIDAEEIDTSASLNDHGNDDDDELLHPPTKKPGAWKRGTNIASAAAAGASKKISPGKKQRPTTAAAAAVVGSKGAKKSAGTTKKAGGGGVVLGEVPSTKAKKTYTRRMVAEKNKENADPDTDPKTSHEAHGNDVEMSSSPPGPRDGSGRLRIGGPELKRAARWFREVDRWELEFEEGTASSDSVRMRDAR